MAAAAPPSLLAETDTHTHSFPSAGSLPQMPVKARAEPGRARRREELHVGRGRSSTWAAGTQGLSSSLQPPQVHRQEAGEEAAELGSLLLSLGCC